jgi:ornithine decarboxylase
MAQATVLRFDRSKARRIDATPAFADAAAAIRAAEREAAVFCFSAETLKDRAHEFLDGFPGEVSFAVKSNSSPEVVKALYAAGLRVWDVASLQEMEIVSGSVPKAEFHYHNPVKSRREIEAAYQRFGCRRFAIDSREELEKIAAIVGTDQGVEIAVRFVLPRQDKSSAHDFSTKFGVGETEAVALLQQVASLGFKPVLTFHPGSQCKDPSAYGRHIRAAGAIAALAHVKLHRLNVGGGFPGRYAVSQAPELSKYFAEIEVAVAEVFGEAAPALECEPGRGLVSGCMSLLTRVKLVRGSRNEIFLNDGVYGALMEVWQVPELQPPHRIIRNGEIVADQSRLVTVYGPTCDPLDKLPMMLSVPADIAEGDYIEFGSLGAYGQATMTEFNGYGGHATLAVEKVLQA